MGNSVWCRLVLFFFFTDTYISLWSSKFRVGPTSSLNGRVLRGSEDTLKHPKDGHTDTPDVCGTVWVSLSATHTCVRRARGLGDEDTTRQ